MMRDAWFVRRTPEQGQGYSLANWKGLVFVLLVSVLAAVALIIPWLAFHEAAPAVAIGLFVVFGLICALIVVVQRKSR